MKLRDQVKEGPGGVVVQTKGSVLVDGCELVAGSLLLRRSPG